VIAGEPLLTAYYNDPGRLEQAQALLSGAFQLGPEAPPLSPLIRDVMRP
jgi:hypothetical protein